MKAACARGFVAIFACVVCVAFDATSASAQGAPELRAHHLTINAGLLWAGGYDVGDATAQLRGNAAGASAAPFTLFTAESRVSTSIAPEIKVGVAVTPRLVLEGGVSFSSPRIGVSIAADAE
ncbi:MAG TPA: hypothetical protein VF491_17110, partial [Vicinamibacterales bacterium]